MKIDREQFEIEVDDGIYYHAAGLVTPKAVGEPTDGYDIIAVFREDTVIDRIEYDMHLVGCLYGVRWTPLERVWEHFERMVEEDWEVYKMERKEN